MKKILVGFILVLVFVTIIFTLKNANQNDNREMKLTPIRSGTAPIASIFKGKGITHDYVSFLSAAADFSEQMNSATVYKISGKIALNNVVKRSDQFVGDHDGYAVILERKQQND